MRNSSGVPHSTERCKITKYSASPQAICHFLTLFYCPRRYICSDWPVQFQNVLSFRVLKRICHPRSRDATPVRLPSVLPFTRHHSGASPKRIAIHETPLRCVSQAYCHSRDATPVRLPGVNPKWECHPQMTT